MKRNSFQSTQAFIDALVQVNKEMEENQQQMTLIIQGLLDKIGILTKENEELKTVLEQTINQIDELKRKKEMIEEVDEKTEQLKYLRQQNYLSEQTNINQIDDLRVQLKHRDKQIELLQKDHENIANEIVMSRQQISLLVTQLGNAQKEIMMQKQFEEYNKRLNEINVKFDEMRKSVDRSFGNKSSIIEDSVVENKENKYELNFKIKEELDVSGIQRNELKSSPIRIPRFRKNIMIGKPKQFILLSGISKDQLIDEIIRKGKEVQNVYNENITHVIVSSKLTMTCLRALFEGKWVVSKNWIMDGMRNDEFKYGYQKIDYLKGKKVYASKEFTFDPSGMELWELLVKYAKIEVVEEPEIADLCLIGKKEIIKGKNVFTKDTFLKSLPLPKTVLDDGMIPTKMILTKTPIAI